MDPATPFAKEIQLSLEIAVNLHNFVNIELCSQGWYAVRVTLLPDDAAHHAPILGVIENELMDRPDDRMPWAMEAVNCFCSSAMQIRYCQQQVDLGEAVSFHAFYKPPAEMASLSCTVEFELLCQPINPKWPDEKPSRSKLKPVAKETFRIASIAEGAHEYVGVTFDEDHLALCNATVHTILHGFTTTDLIDGWQKANPKAVAAPQVRGQAVTTFNLRSQSMVLLTRNSGRGLMHSLEARRAVPDELKPRRPANPELARASHSSAALSPTRRDSLPSVINAWASTTGKAGSLRVGSMAADDWSGNAVLNLLRPNVEQAGPHKDKARAIYQYFTGALVKSRASLEAFLKGLPPGCYMPQSLVSLRGLIAQQGGMSLPHTPTIPEEKLQDLVVASGVSTGLSTLSTQSKEPQAPTDGSPALPVLKIKTATAEGGAGSAGKSVEARPLEGADKFIAALFLHNNIDAALQHMNTTWTQVAKAAAVDWGVVQWILRTTSADLVRGLKERWEARQQAEALPWVLYSSQSQEDGKQPESPRKRSSLGGTHEWKVGIERVDTAAVRRQLKQRKGLHTGKAQRLRTFHKPHRQPLIYVDDSLASTAPSTPASPSPPPSPGGVHAAVFVHGFQGQSSDLCLVRGHLQMLRPDLECFSSRANEGKTDDSIQVLGRRLALEVTEFLQPFAATGRRPLRRLSFVAHSLGNLIVRSALTEPELQPLLPLLWMYLSVSGPHLGSLYSTNALFMLGVNALKMMRPAASSLHQMSFSDSRRRKDCFLYHLAMQPGLRLFKHCVIISCPQDKYVPFHSARVCLCEAAHSDKRHGSAYTDMQHSMTEGLGAAGGGTQLLRVDVEFPYRRHSCSLGDRIGRTAHIDFITSDAYVRLLVWGVLARYGLMQPLPGAWV